MPCILWAALLTMAATGCASLPPVAHVRQQGDFDCGVAALAMLAGQSYQAMVATIDAAHVDSTDGLTLNELFQINTRLKLPVEVVLPSQFDYTTANGVAVVQEQYATNAYAHAVYVRQGMAYDPLRFGPEPYSELSSRYPRFVYCLCLK